MNRVHRLSLSLLACACIPACGPVGVAAGLKDLSDNQNDNQVLLVFVNDNDNPVTLTLNGEDFALAGLQVLPGASTRLQVPQGLDLKVRGQEDTTSAAPVAWDYQLQAGGTQTTSRLSRQAMVFSSVLGKTSSGANQDIFDLQLYDSSAARFQALSSTGLGFSPDLVRLAPGGHRVYTLQDLGQNQVELRAYRVDAGSGSVQLIKPEKTFLQNPVQFGFIDALDCVLDPRGRFLWLLDHNDTTKRTRIRAFALDQDGSPQLRQTFTRGRISDLEISTDGRNAYIAEDFGSGYSLRAMRINAVDGSFDFQINETATPCQALVPDAPQIFLHPAGQSAFVAVADSTPRVRLGSYELLSDGSIRSNAQCLELQVLQDLSFDPRGDVIYITGRNSAGTSGLLRYSIDPINGQLSLIGTQQISASLSNLTSGSDPRLSGSDPAKHTIFMARGDQLVPHSRGAGAVLNPISHPQNGSPTLPYGSNSSVRDLRAALRGTATTQTQN